MYILLTVLRTFLMENLSKFQDILSLVIAFFILITWLFEQKGNKVKRYFIFVTVRAYKACTLYSYQLFVGQT